jgi:signal peptidase II
LKKYIKDYLVLFLISGIIVGIDQWTKALVREKIPLGGSWMPLEWLSPYARFVHWYNKGAAFGFFQNGSIIFATLAVVVIVLIIYYFPRVPANDWTFRVAMSMQLAGASGNLIDRVLFSGKVTDFISVGNFAVFNIADASITIGVFILLLGAWIKERILKKQARNVDPIDSLVPGQKDGNKSE